MPESDASRDEAVQVWQFVKPEDFQMVSMPASEPTRHWLWEAWHNAKEHWKEASDEHEEPEELHRLSSEDLLCVAAPPRWELATESLAEALGDWMRGRDPEVRFVVGPPGSGVAHIVRALAEREGWECLDPPSGEQILEGAEAWLGELIHEVARTESDSWPEDQPPSAPTRADFYRGDGEAPTRAGVTSDETGTEDAGEGDEDQAKQASSSPGQGDPSDDTPDLPPIRALPRLEHCFLRHARGLRVARGLLEACARGSTGPLLIGCGSWAWTYLSCLTENFQSDATSARTPGIRSSSFGPILVPQPFDVERTTVWLRREAERASCPLIFRQVAKGKLLLKTGDVEGEEEEAPAEFVEKLAAFSRGLPEVALAVWKESLRSHADGSLIEAAPDDESQQSENSEEGQEPQQDGESTGGRGDSAAPDEDRSNEEASEGGQEDEEGLAGEASARIRTLWVQPWDEVTLPKVPSSAGRPEAQILHSLLLHGGVRPEDLELVLPLEKASLPPRLKQLERAGLVKLLEGRWWVRKRAYPAVRTWLLSRGVAGDGLGSS
ncbi:MAG TPA: hypothetical protein VLV83_02170 [Acidobacteriota bacterium]|nr:hypothetical protein [Acidobacteriota bacterium]